MYDIVNDRRVFNQARSTGFERAYTYYLAGARFNRTGDRYWISTGLRVQRSNLDGVVSDRDQRIENGYTHVLANMDLKTEVKEGHNLSFGYSTASREPSLTQLQPFVNNTRPVEHLHGQPEPGTGIHAQCEGRLPVLRPVQLRQFLYLRRLYLHRQPDRPVRFFDDRGVQTRSPINTDASWSAQVGANFGTPLRRLGVDMDLEYRLTYREGTELVNLVANDNLSTTNTVELTLTNRFKERFDVRGGASFDFNDARYSLNQELNRDYVNSRYFANGTLYAPWAWTIRSTFSYRVFDQGLYGSGQSRFGQPENIARWDASVMRRLLNDRSRSSCAPTTS